MTSCGDSLIRRVSIVQTPTMPISIYAVPLRMIFGEDFDSRLVVKADPMSSGIGHGAPVKAMIVEVCRDHL